MARERIRGERNWSGTDPDTLWDCIQLSNRHSPATTFSLSSLPFLSSSLLFCLLWADSCVISLFFPLADFFQDNIVYVCVRLHAYPFNLGQLNVHTVDKPHLCGITQAEISRKSSGFGSLT